MLVDEMAAFADEKGIGIYDPEGSGGNIYIGILPDTPTDLVSIFPRGGPPRDPLDEYVVVAIQFIVRSLRKLDGLSKGQAIIDAFHGFSHGTFVEGGLHIVDCLSQNEPADIGQDGNNRYEWSINLSVEYHKEEVI